MEKRLNREIDNITSGIGRREMLGYSALFGSAFLARNGMVNAQYSGTAALEKQPDHPPKKIQHEKINKHVGVSLSG